jgi:hypothetical protein
MANSLLIEKETGGYFGFTLTIDGVVQEKIRNLANDALAIGNICHFKTSNGANLVKVQNISVFDITLIASGSFTFTNIDTFFQKLIDVGYWDWLLGGGSGSGSDRFDELLDTFQYFGNDGKAVRVNESQQKLEPFTIYNYKNLTELEDTFDSIVANKMLATNEAGDKIILKDLPTEPEQYLQSVGYFDYADLATQTVPLTLVANVPKKLTNDTLGFSTNLVSPPYGVSRVWNSVTNQFDFTELSIGDTIDFRFDAKVTTTINNQVVKGFVKIAVGSPSEYTLGIFGQQIKTAGTNTQTVFTSLYIGSEDIYNFPSEVYIVSENSGSVSVNGWYCRVLRKGINLVEVAIDSDYHDAPEKTTIVDADEIAGQNSANFYSIMRVKALNFWNYIKSKADLIYEKTSNKSDSYTASSSVTYASTKALVDGLSNVSTISHLEFSNTDKTVWNNGKGNVTSNTSFGDQNLIANTSGVDNASFGFRALMYLIGLSDRVVAFGSNAGRYFGTNSPLTTALGSIFIGYNTRASADNSINETVIGNDVVGAGNNSVTLGNTSVTKTILRGVVETNAPAVNPSDIPQLGQLDSQIEIGASTNVSNLWNRKTLIITANCTLTVPSSLLSEFGFVFRTLAGVTVTWAITAPFTWETTPTTTPEKTTGNFMRRGNTNTILLDF